MPFGTINSRTCPMKPYEAQAGIRLAQGPRLRRFWGAAVPEHSELTPLQPSLLSPASQSCGCSIPCLAAKCYSCLSVSQHQVNGYIRSMSLFLSSHQNWCVLKNWWCIPSSFKPTLTSLENLTERVLQHKNFSVSFKSQENWRKCSDSFWWSLDSKLIIISVIISCMFL